MGRSLRLPLSDNERQRHLSQDPGLLQSHQCGSLCEPADRMEMLFARHCPVLAGPHHITIHLQRASQRTTSATCHQMTWPPRQSSSLPCDAAARTTARAALSARDLDQRQVMRINSERQCGQVCANHLRPQTLLGASACALSPPRASEETLSRLYPPRLDHQ